MTTSAPSLHWDEVTGENLPATKAWQARAPNGFYHIIEHPTKPPSFVITLNGTIIGVVRERDKAVEAAEAHAASPARRVP